MKQDRRPRVLNATDLPSGTATPQQVLSPEGDFNADGNPDIAISGLYQFGDGPGYFLLVGTRRSNPVRFEKLIFEEGKAPYFIHKPGATGESDPGDQAFSISSCTACENGFDFYWDKRGKKFERRAWKEKRVQGTRVIVTPAAPDLPEGAVEKALRIVGPLKDVQKFVIEANKRKNTLATRVKPSSSPDEAVVEIFEKVGGTEKLYDRITVSLSSEQVVRRETQAMEKDKSK